MNVKDLLTEQLHQLEQLLETLTAERECLKEGRADGEVLNTLATHKQAQLAELERLEHLRRDAQQAQGLGDGARGAEQLADIHDADQLWGQIRQQADRLKQMNRLNGFVISQRMEHNQRAIDFLERAVGGSVYGRNGQAKPKNFSGISSRA
ncbi:flagella synthesis protein FlgN [Salinicola sp. DM10]|uniref:flagella synthesis protein FlgN n=1 Tax=Salinicola sp. DM10 TaxID=2815721 RepID=UPI001A90C77E|nr:flagellar protein FlgN [Salinicola sp. DM10]MCE3025831.1 flagellar protein FlgN [Salinicola sp. DM10]